MQLFKIIEHVGIKSVLESIENNKSNYEKARTLLCQLLIQKSYRQFKIID